MKDNRLIGEVPLYSACIKYDRLKAIIDEEYKDYPHMNFITLFVDINSIVKSYFGDTKGREYEFEDYYSIASGIINICAHYRQFFKTRYRMYCVVHLVYSNIQQKNVGSMFLKEYTNKLNLNNVKMLKTLEDNINMLSILTPYLPDIQLSITDKFETGVMINDIINKEVSAGNVNPNIILTKDRYNYQLLMSNNDITILRPRKNEDDISYAVSKKSVIRQVLTDYWSYEKAASAGFNNVNASWLSTLFVLSRLPDKGITSYVSIDKALNIIKKIVDDGIYQVTSDFSFMANTVISKYYPKASNDYFIIENRYKGIDLGNAYMIFLNTSEANTYKGIVNLVDDNTVKEINNKYFVKNPLDLNAL